jgi:soluble lytic murein transglycosylase-like protein
VARPASTLSHKPNPQIELPPSTETPSAFANLVDRIAEKHEVDRDLVNSVIRIESNYNPLAVSNKGALGLMQLVPSTARRFGVSNSFNPAENVEGGVRYLKYLLEHYNGDHRLALAAYNAGEGTVERYGGVPPFPETRSYVYRVGKALDQTKEAKKQRSPERSPAKSADGFNHVRAFKDAMGRVYYRTP